MNIYMNHNTITNYNAYMLLISYKIYIISNIYSTCCYGPNLKVSNYNYSYDHHRLILYFA